MIIPSLRSYGLFGLGAIAVVALAQWLPLDQVTAVMLLYDLGLLVLMGIDGHRARRRRADLGRLPLGRLSLGRVDTLRRKRTKILNSATDL
ncbi:hypothetical protein PN441_18765 [Spirulina major CS-329]|uniref:hypothetical protein n=1 Tax=Spirulina TaxID=1154 RepID=UPI00232F7CB0|nr:MULTISPECIES: hypothetical protein [Spirulina]MDB9496573.1 hypothetical protein [Spirulina subsalsa CS-330]MDB9505126.1 hypothetical protein [Spirulina major CS-329]